MMIGMEIQLLVQPLMEMKLTILNKKRKMRLETVMVMARMARMAKTTMELTMAMETKMKSKMKWTEKMTRQLQFTTQCI